MAELTTVRIQEYAKSCCHKTNLGNYFDDPTLLLTGSLKCTWVYIAARRLDYSTQEAVLSQRAAKCGLIYNSVKLSVLRNWTLICFATSWGVHGLDRNRTCFFL